MADIEIAQNTALPNDTKSLYKDMGDGTHALGVFARAPTSEPLPVRLLSTSVPEPVPVSIEQLSTAFDLTTGTLVALDLGLRAAVNGDAVGGFINDITPGAALTVLANAPLLYNIPDDQCVLITMVSMELATANDNVEYEFGYTTEIDAGGIFYPLTPVRRLWSGAAMQEARMGTTIHMYPPVMVCYTNARCITFRVTCNDAGCTITPSWWGYILNTGA